MAVKLSRTAYDHAKGLVKEGRVVLDAMDDWSEHQPSAEDEKEFIEEHGYAEYGKWHSGSTTSTDRRPRATTSTRTATSRTCTAAGC
jgi:hypothetical protein